MITFEWHSFSPGGGTFIAKSQFAKATAVFMTGEEAAALAEEDGESNHAHCYRPLSMVGFIDHIEVKKPSRREGHGTAILKAVLDKFRELGVGTIFLRAVPEDPDLLGALLRFYSRFGFELAPECMDDNDSMPMLRADLG